VQDGHSEAEVRGRFRLVDRGGLLHTGRTDLTPEQRAYAQPAEHVANWPRTFHGTIGLADVTGLSTVGAFTEPITREMARKVDRPVIFPLSNPTIRSEANPEDVIRWTGGRALVATGSRTRRCGTRAGRSDRPVRQRLHLPAVGLEAQRAGVAPKTRREELRDRVAATQWAPAYPRTVSGG
jgi:malate dehydrogenase (oxaloacetate-decarboxylating)